MDFFRSHDEEHQLNIGTVDNPTYEQAIIQSTQSNINYQCADLPNAQYLIPVKVKSNTLTNTCILQVNDTLVRSFIKMILKWKTYPHYLMISRLKKV